jgi:hypothetical protein
LAEAEEHASAPAKPEPPPPEAEGVDIGALMAQAEVLYERRLYRKAIVACDRLDALGYGGGIVAMMREGCRQALWRRRVLRISLGVSAAVVLALAALLYVPFTRVYVEPAGGIVRIAERESQRFQVTRPFGRHRKLEYAWTLLDADGRAIATDEQAALKPASGAPWACTYTPPLKVARAADGQHPVLRGVRVQGLDGRGHILVTAEWSVEVTNVEMPPTIVETLPPKTEILVIAPGGSRSFRVQALDGDAGHDLAFEWLVDGLSLHRGTEPEWTYTPGPRVQPGERIRQQVVCRLANRHGKPFPRECAWDVQLVGSNAPPQIVKVTPALRPYHRLREGEELRLAAVVFDPDKEKGDLIRFRWEVGDDTISRSKACTLYFPRDTTVTETEVALRLTITDLCGATDTLTWPLVIVNAGR